VSQSIFKVKKGYPIGLIDADLLDNGTRHPNLALMKISGYFKESGLETVLLHDYSEIENFQKVFISKVFSFTNTPEFGVKKNVIIGGTGFFQDGGKDLPNEIEHHMPDYNLYNSYINNMIKNGQRREYYKDYLNYSIGFTTRGCFRKCDFCVNKKYNKVYLHSPVREFLDENRKGIYLWDDNIFGFDKWENVFDDIESTGKPFQFRQGLDIRLLNERKARRLSLAKYIGDYIFAFDHIKDRELIERKLKIWKNYSNKTTKLYLLCGYTSVDHVDIYNTFERIRILMKFGCLPYIMRYQNYKKSEYRTLYITIARWCNQPKFFKKMSFREFCLANQKYHKNPNTLCSALKSLNYFESKFPDIAKKYFDLKFENLSLY